MGESGARQVGGVRGRVLRRRRGKQKQRERNREGVGDNSQGVRELVGT